MRLLLLLLRCEVNGGGGVGSEAVLTVVVLLFFSWFRKDTNVSSRFSLSDEVSSEGVKAEVLRDCFLRSCSDGFDEAGVVPPTRTEVSLVEYREALTASLSRAIAGVLKDIVLVDNLA